MPYYRDFKNNPSIERIVYITNEINQIIDKLVYLNRTTRSTELGKLLNIAFTKNFDSNYTYIASKPTCYIKKPKIKTNVIGKKFHFCDDIYNKLLEYCEVHNAKFSTALRELIEIAIEHNFDEHLNYVDNKDIISKINSNDVIPFIVIDEI